MITQDTSSKLVKGMVSSGVPFQQAVALTLALEHSLDSPEYASRYGTVMVDALRALVATATAGDPT